ncbi:hypothetical protein HAX54_048140, partial [Datura stramonium]|nr:hypothetical protein [Datura stramonium]
VQHSSQLEAQQKSDHIHKSTPELNRCHAGGFGMLLELDLCATSWHLRTASSNIGGLEGALLDPN